MSVAFVKEIARAMVAMAKSGLKLKTMIAVCFSYLFFPLTVQGVCGGNNACYDCTDTPWGDHLYDSCGKCLAPTDPLFDSCVGCDDVAWSKLEDDRCDICNGTVWFSVMFE